MSKPIAATVTIPKLGTFTAFLQPYARGSWQGDLVTDEYSIAVYVNPRRGEYE